MSSSKRTGQFIKKNNKATSMQHWWNIDYFDASHNDYQFFQCASLIAVSLMYHWWFVDNSLKKHWGNSSWRLKDIQRWSPLIQNKFSSVSALFITWKSQNSANFLWNSAEQRWFWANSEWQFLVHFSVFQIFLNYFIFEARKSGFQPNLQKEVNNKNLNVQFSYPPKL